MSLSIDKSLLDAKNLVLNFQQSFGIITTLDASFTVVMTRNKLKRRGRSNTYLTYVCRQPWSIKTSINRYKTGAFSQYYGFHQLQKQIDGSHSVGRKLLFSICPLDFLRSAAIYRHESGRSHSFLPFSTFFFSNSSFQVFLLHYHSQL